VRVVFETVDNARNAVFDERRVKVDEQAEALVGEPEAGRHFPGQGIHPWPSLVSRQGTEFEKQEFIMAPRDQSERRAAIPATQDASLRADCSRGLRLIGWNHATGYK
jgi:hypothetical protein